MILWNSCIVKHELGMTNGKVSYYIIDRVNDACTAKLRTLVNNSEHTKHINLKEETELLCAAFVFN